MLQSSPPTLEQRRSNHAWNAITSLKRNEKYGEDAEEYAREAKKLPMRIMAAGLGHALLFIHAKANGKKPNLEQLLKDINSWVLQERKLPCTDQASLIQSIVHGNADFLRRATDETIAYLAWLNRFAEAEGLKTDEGAAK